MKQHCLLPKLLGFAESAWTSPRSWETEQAAEKINEEILQVWSVFANTVVQRELPKTAEVNGGYAYRLLSAGAIHYRKR